MEGSVAAPALGHSAAGKRKAAECKRAASNACKKQRAPELQKPLAGQAAESRRAAENVSKKQRGSGARRPLAVTDWVTVHLNQTRQVNKNIANAPAIVSSVDQEKGTVNVLFPNRLSAFFHRFCPQTCVRFSIQTFPVSKVHHHESSSVELKPLLQHALSSFAELREATMRSAGKPCTEEEAVFAPESAAASADASQATIQASDHGDGSAAPGDLETSSKRSVPEGAAPLCSEAKKDVVVLCSGPKEDPAAPAKQLGDLGGFMRELAQLLQEGASGSAAKAQVQASLSSNYPEWDDYLVQLDQMNKVLLAEDAVFSLA